MKPTKNKVKRFWEWCGFKAVKYKDCWTKPLDIMDESILGADSICHYDYPDKIEPECSLPDIDLNNLFKYAIPKLEDYEINFNSDGEVSIFLGDDPDIKCYEAIDKDPATALCLAISKVIDNE